MSIYIKKPLRSANQVNRSVRIILYITCNWVPPTYPKLRETLAFSLKKCIYTLIVNDIDSHVFFHVNSDTDKYHYKSLSELTPGPG